MKNFHVQSVLSQNITLVYPTLDFQKIDSNAIRHLAGVPAEQMLFASDHIHVAYPLPGTLLLQIAENRAIVIQKEPAEAIGSLPLWEIAWKCNQLLVEANPSAYGFNYDIDLTIDEGNTSTALGKLITPDSQQIEQVLAGSLNSASFTSRFSFQRERVSCDLVVQPVDQAHIRIHYNAHFRIEDELPGMEALEKAYRHQFEELIAIFARL